MNLSRRGFAAALPALIAGSHLAAAQEGQAPAYLPSGVYVFAARLTWNTVRSCRARRLTRATFPSTNRLLRPTVSLIRLTTTRAEKCF